MNVTAVTETTITVDFSPAISTGPPCEFWMREPDWREYLRWSNEYGAGSQTKVFLAGRRMA